MKTDDVVQLRSKLINRGIEQNLFSSNPRGWWWERMKASKAVRDSGVRSAQKFRKSHSVHRRNRYRFRSVTFGNCG